MPPVSPLGGLAPEDEVTSVSDFVIFLGAMGTLVVDFDDMTLDGMRAIAIAVQNVSL